MEAYLFAMHTQWITRRIHLDDVRKMIMAHDQISAVVQALRGTNWAGAQTAIAALAPVDLWIIDLYTRCEPSWQKYLQNGKRAASTDSVYGAAPQDAGSPEGEAMKSEPGE